MEMSMKAKGDLFHGSTKGGHALQEKKKILGKGKIVM